MASAISPATTLTQPKVGVPQPPKSLGSRVKNTLVGRLANWKDPVFISGAIYYVAKAAFNLIAGYWFVSLVSLITSVIFACLPKLLHDYANLRAETHQYRLSNLEHKNLNHDQAKNNRAQKKTIEEQKRITEQQKESIKNLSLQVEELNDKLVRLETVTKSLEATNQRTVENNQIFELHLGVLDTTITKLNVEIGAALATGNEISQEILEGFQMSVAHFEEQKQSLYEIAAEIKDENSAALQKFENVVKQMENTNDAVIEGLDREIKNRMSQLDQTTQDLFTVREKFKKERKKLGSTADRIDKGIDNLLEGKELKAEVTKLKTENSQLRARVKQMETGSTWGSLLSSVISNNPTVKPGNSISVN